MTKEKIIEELLDKTGNLLFTKLKNKYPEYTKEMIYKIYHENKITGYCPNNHPLEFISFKKGYKKCKICEDLEGTYSKENIKQLLINKSLKATHLRKIKKYYNLSPKELYLTVYEKKYCHCGKECIFINCVKGYAKTCSQKCGNNLKRKKLSNKEQKLANEKRKRTNIEKYGVEYNLQLLDNSGDKNCMKNSYVKNKKNKTMIDIYGTIYPLQNKSIKEKAKNTKENNKKDTTFGAHPSRSHYYHIEDFNEEYIEKNFIKDGAFIENKFEEYFNCSNTTTLRIKRYFNLWDESISFPEQIMQKYLSNFYKTKKVIPPYEIDFYYNELKFGVEVHGDYWHSIESGTDKNYHKMKADMCKEKGVTLYQFFENEIINHEDIISSMISAKLNKNKRIFARKCTIKEIKTKDAKNFLETTHLQGYARSSIKLGLFYDNTLVQCMTLGKPRYNKKVEYELIRFSTSLNTTVIGGFSKLLSYFEKKYKPKNILSYANRRWSEGDVYIKTGFIESHRTEPGFMYFLRGKYYAREQLQNHKLSNFLEKYDSNLTAKENIRNNGFLTLYDAGNIVYIKNVKD